MRLFANSRYISLSILTLGIWTETVSAEWTQARCDIYPMGSDHAEKVIPCTFTQRHGYITIARSDDIVYELSPIGTTPGDFTDQLGRKVYRQSGLGDQGQIYRFPAVSIYLYWNTTALEVPDEKNPTWPFTTSEYDATMLLRCRISADAETGSCPAGVVRMEDGQASITVQSLRGEQFTINFMKDYINATNRQLSSRLDGDTWVLQFENGEVWEVPRAAIEGG